MFTLRNPGRLPVFASEMLHNMLGSEESVIGFNPPLNLEGKTGGVLCIADSIRGQPVTVTLIGSVPDEKMYKYWNLACEKAQRLSSHPEHVSSWQSRDGINLWGGAIRSDSYLFSFSGLPELWDEAFMLMLAFESSSIKEDACERIATISSNPYWLPLKHGYGYE